MKHWILLAFVAVLLAVLALQAGPVRASVEAKPTAPPTPTNPPPPTEEPPPPPPPPEPPTPTPTEKPPAPATPVPTNPPPAMEQPPTEIPTAAPTQPPPTAIPPTATSQPPTSTATATPAARPTRAATATATPLPFGDDRGHSSGSSPGSLPAWLGALPPWALPAGGAGLVFLLLFGVWIVVRFVHYTGRDLAVKQRMIAESEAARLEERRRQVEAILVGQKDWQRIIGQVIADTLGQAVQLNAEIPPRVGGKPAPYFTVADAEGVRYTFTTDVKALQEVGLVKKRVRPRPVASPVEPGLVWRHLAETWLREAGEVVPAVPTGAAWVLVVVR